MPTPTSVQPVLRFPHDLATVHARLCQHGSECADHGRQAWCGRLAAAALPVLGGAGRGNRDDARRSGTTAARAAVTRYRVPSAKVPTNSREEVRSATNVPHRLDLSQLYPPATLACEHYSHDVGLPGCLEGAADPLRGSADADRDHSCGSAEPSCSVSVRRCGRPGLDTSGRPIMLSRSSSRPRRPSHHPRSRGRQRTLPRRLSRPESTRSAAARAASLPSPRSSHTITVR